MGEPVALGAVYGPLPEFLRRRVPEAELRSARLIERELPWLDLHLSVVVAQMNQRLRELQASRETAPRDATLPVGEHTVTDTPTTAPPAGSFAEATASVLKPAAIAPAAKPVASAAAKIAALTKDRLAFNADLDQSITDYAQKMNDAKAKKAAVFTKAHKAIDDEVAGFDDLDTALSDFSGANGGGPLPG